MLREKFGAPEPVDPGPAPRPLNLDAVLDLGNTCYFLFRGRAYGVPPLPWRAGELLLDAKLEAMSIGRLVDREELPRYYASLRQLSRILWRHTRCVGRVRRLAHRLGIMRNPYRNASDQQLVELVDFFLGRRMSRGDLRPLAGVPELGTF